MKYSPIQKFLSADNYQIFRKLSLVRFSLLLNVITKLAKNFNYTLDFTRITFRKYPCFKIILWNIITQKLINFWEKPTRFATILLDNPSLRNFTILSLITSDNSLVAAKLALKKLRRMITWNRSPVFYVTINLHNSQIYLLLNFKPETSFWFHTFSYVIAESILISPVWCLIINIIHLININ